MLYDAELGQYTLAFESELPRPVATLHLAFNYSLSGEGLSGFYRSSYTRACVFPKS